MSARRAARAASLAGVKVDAPGEYGERQCHRLVVERDPMLGRVLVTFRGGVPHRARWSGTPSHPGGMVSEHFDPDRFARTVGHLL